MTKRSISKADYLQLVGLLALADRYDRLTREVFAAAAELTGEVDEQGEPDDLGHTSDAVWDANSRDASRLLQRLGITVETLTAPGA